MLFGQQLLKQVQSPALFLVVATCLLAGHFKLAAVLISACMIDRFAAGLSELAAEVAAVIDQAQSAVKQQHQQVHLLAGHLQELQNCRRRSDAFISCKTQSLQIQVLSWLLVAVKLFKMLSTSRIMRAVADVGIQQLIWREIPCLLKPVALAGSRGHFCVSQPCMLAIAMPASSC